MAESEAEPQDVARANDKKKPEHKSSLPRWHSKQGVHADQIIGVELDEHPPTGSSGVKWQLLGGSHVVPSIEDVQEHGTGSVGSYVIENENGSFELVDAETFEETYEAH